MADKPTKQYLSLYSVAGQPYLGMISSIDTAALAPGYWELGQNVRAHKVALEARYGASEFIPRTITSGTSTSAMSTSVVYSGHKFTNNNRYLAVNTTSNVVSIYRYRTVATNTALSGWAINASFPTITATTPYTWLEAFTLPQPGANIQLWSAAGSGTFNPYQYMVANTGGTSAYVSASLSTTGPQNWYKVEALLPPKEAKAIPTVMDYFSIKTAVTTGTSSTSTSTTLTVPTLTGVGPYLQINLSTGTASSQSVTFGTTTATTILASSNWTNVRQTQIVFGGTDAAFLDMFNVSIAFSAGGTHYYTHVNGITKPQIATVGDRYYSALLDCSTLYTATAASTSGISLSSLNVTGVAEVRFTYVGTSSPATATTVPIYAVTFAGGVPFNTQFGQTLYNHLTTSESPPTICENQPAPGLAESGGTPIKGVTLAMTPSAKYAYRIQWAVPDTQSTCSLTYARLGDTYYINDQTVSFYSSPTVGTTASRTLYTTTYGAWTMPSVNTRPIPGGGPITLMGDRLYAAAQINGDRSQIAFSEKGMPNRFAYAVDVVQGQVQPKSGGVADFGNETIWGITPTAGNLYGSDTGLVHTDRGVYAMQGVDALQLSRPANVGPYGCISPWSIFRYRNAVGWITPERELRILGDDIGSLSARTIEDKLLGIPAAYLPNVTAAVAKDRLYIGYTPSGGTTNTQCLVYDARVNAFVSDDTLANSATYTRLDTVLNSTDSALIGFHTNGWCYQYEVNTTGDQSMAGVTTTTESTVELRSRCLSDEFWNQIRIGDICIAADDLGSGKTFTTTLTNRQTGATATGTINMNGSSSMVWRKGRGSAENARIGQTSVGVQLKLSGTMAPGKKIFSIGVESEKVSQVGYDVE